MARCELPDRIKEGGGPTAARVLEIGSAPAVLISDSSREPDGRDRQAQAVLRRTTGRWDLSISRRPSGRPRLAPPYPELGISMSHRGDLMLAAFSSVGAVGVDLEIDTPDLDPVRLASDHFAAAEAKAVALLEPARARDVFLRLWVAKEAALKVTGRGIHDGLGEPDLHRYLDLLRIEGSPMSLAASDRLPSLTLAVRRYVRRGAPAVYCGLAVEV